MQGRAARTFIRARRGRYFPGVSPGPIERIGSDNWYLGMAGVAMLLALGGGIAAAAAPVRAQERGRGVAGRFAGEPFAQAHGLPAARRRQRAAGGNRAAGCSVTHQRAG